MTTWWTSLKLPAKQVIELYHQHGTSEQFHSEIKSDMDLERLPSGKFATNALMLSLGQVAYNVLRLCGQTAFSRTASCRRRSRCRFASRWPSSVAERDSGLDVLGGPLDASLPSPGPVVLAKQSLAWDLGAIVRAVYGSAAPGHRIVGGKTDATNCLGWRRVWEMLCRHGGGSAAVASI